MTEFKRITFCDRKGHCFSGRYNEKIVKQHNDYHETVVEKIYIYDICPKCGKIVTMDEETIPEK